VPSWLPTLSNLRWGRGRFFRQVQTLKHLSLTPDKSGRWRGSSSHGTRTAARDCFGVEDLWAYNIFAVGSHVIFDLVLAVPARVLAVQWLVSIRTMHIATFSMEVYLVLGHYGRISTGIYTNWAKCLSQGILSIAGQFLKDKKTLRHTFRRIECWKWVQEPHKYFRNLIGSYCPWENLS
jgi:hypothetical protein